MTDLPIGEEKQALDDWECVNIVQLSDTAALGYDDSDDQIFTSESYSPFDGNFQWCMTLISSLRYLITPLERPTKFMDAYEYGNDYAAVLRDPQNDGSQTWTVIPDFGGGYLFVQLSSVRYLDAYTSGDGGDAVTREHQSNGTQNWLVDPAVCECD